MTTPAHQRLFPRMSERYVNGRHPHLQNSVTRQ
jgi:hypothetical protein